MTNKNLKKIMYQSWEESERGWGTRPDGCSLHLYIEHLNGYLKEYWIDMRAKNGEIVPDEYEREAGRPVIAYVSEELYGEIKNTKNGLRLWQGKEREYVEKKDLVYGERRSGWVSEGGMSARIGDI